MAVTAMGLLQVGAAAFAAAFVIALAVLVGAQAVTARRAWDVGDPAEIEVAVVTAQHAVWVARKAAEPPGGP